LIDHAFGSLLQQPIFITDISFELSRLVVPSHVAWAMARMRGRLGKLRLKWMKMDEHVSKTKNNNIF
jgi:hypothetical protein